MGPHGPPVRPARIHREGVLSGSTTPATWPLMEARLTHLPAPTQAAEPALNCSARESEIGSIMPTVAASGQEKRGNPDDQEQVGDIEGEPRQGPGHQEVPDVAQGHAIYGVPEDAGEHHGSRQAVGPPQLPLYRVSDPHQQGRAGDAEEGENRV